MSIVLRRSYLKGKHNVLPTRNGNSGPVSSCFTMFFSRTFNEDKTNGPEYSNSTILMENGLNVQELPLLVRKLKDFSEIEQKPNVEDRTSVQDSISYNLIHAEFKQCIDLRDVFSLLSKCTKITPNIALGAMERIYDLEKNPSSLVVDSNMHVTLAKGAILDKLLKVIVKTEDTQTIINILKSTSSFMLPYKHNFCDELLFRVIDNKLTVEQLCEFASFLIANRSDTKYSDMIDKLWVGFVERENDINERNIVEIFKLLPGLKASKRTILNLSEQKFADLWSKMKGPEMQEILNIFVEEKYSSFQSLAVVGRWLYLNIHALDEDSLLNIVTKLTRLNYSDNQTEIAVEKFMRLKGSRVQSHILIVGILNYCMQFQIRNHVILNMCSVYFQENGTEIRPSFLKSFIYPFGYLCFSPANSSQFWMQSENVLEENFDRITPEDLSSIVLSFIYMGQYPLKIIKRMFSSEYLVKMKSLEALKRLYLIDTALLLECEAHSVPLLPKDQCTKPVSQDVRIKKIIEKIKDPLIAIAGGTEKISTAVLIPFLSSDETYLIDVMLHPAGLDSKNYNWKLKSGKNENTAILIHLPDHYCSDNQHLIGPQVMRMKHLRLLGLKVVSLKYSTISQFYTSYNTSGLKSYLEKCIDNAEPCLN